MLLFGRNVQCNRRDVLKQTVQALQPGDSAFFCNVHMLMQSRSDSDLADAMDAATVVFPDGVPVAWLQRRLGKQEASVLRGYEAMELLCEKAANRGESVGLFGASDDVLAALRDKLQAINSQLRITYIHAPPIIGENEPSSLETIKAINEAAPDYLFIGLGCPKQEKWIHRHRTQLSCALLGVGAAFGWLAGTTPRPPRWMENIGLGWLFRLIMQPRRTAKRYFVYNTQFVFQVTKLLVFGRKSSTDSH